MTQVKSARPSRTQVVSSRRASGHTLAKRRASIEAQIRQQVTAAMALDESELTDVSRRLKELRDELARKRGVREVSQHRIANELDMAPRTFQSHENGEVEPRGLGYQRYADYYTEHLERPVSKNWIMFGSDDPPEEQTRPPRTKGSTPDLFASEAPAWAKELSSRLASLEETVARMDRTLRGDKAQELSQEAVDRARVASGRSQPDPHTPDATETPEGNP